MRSSSARALFVLWSIGAALPSAAGAQVRVPDEPRFLVSAPWLAEHLGDSDLVVIHVARDSTSYREGHIPGAYLLVLSSIVVQRPDLPNELPSVSDLVAAFASVGVRNDRRLVLYGDLGGLAAARAFFTLDYLGLGDRAALLDGGLEVWRAEGRPVETASSKAPDAPLGSLRARPRTEVVVDAAWIAQRLGRDDLVLLDARPEGEYAGREPGSGIARAGHIPGAVNFYWREALVSAERPLLLDRAALEARYRALGVREGVEIVTYCRTGMQASHAYFVARYLGYTPKMYDGSYIDWSAKTGLPVESR